MKTGIVYVRDSRHNGVIGQNRQKIPGGDQRYAYVIYHELHEEDKQRARAAYPHSMDHLPHHEYQYPITKGGRLASARRHISAERAKELYELHQVRQVMES